MRRHVIQEDTLSRKKNYFVNYNLSALHKPLRSRMFYVHDFVKLTVIQSSITVNFERLREH